MYKYNFMKCYNILIMIEDSDSTKVLWLDNDNNFVESRDNSKILLDEESKEVADKIRNSGKYLMVGRFPADIDWKSSNGEVLSCPTKTKLEGLLKKCLEIEDYEEACVLRDRLKLLK